jgi:hypothetical protein
MLKKKWNQKLVKLGIYSTIKIDNIESVDENLTYFDPEKGDWYAIDNTISNEEMITSLLIQQTEYLKSIHSNVIFLTIVIGINFAIAICGLFLGISLL